MLGFPKTHPRHVETQKKFNTTGKIQRFENGAMILSHRDVYSGKDVAFEVWGAIGWEYQNIGGVESDLGFPITREIYVKESVARSVFQGGVIVWDGNQEYTTVHFFPKPEIQLELPSSVKLGEPLRIRVIAWNRGGKAEDGYFSVAFPDLAIVDSDLCHALSDGIEIKHYPARHEIGGSYGDGKRYRLKYPMVEAVWAPVQPNTMSSFELTVTPRKLGEFRVEYKCSMRSPAELGFIADPPIGSNLPLEQQEEHVHLKIPQVINATGTNTKASSDNIIFISYRRDDSEKFTRRIHSQLVAKYGQDKVFLDQESIKLGLDWKEVLREAIAKSIVVLVIIGPKWLGDRLSEKNDFVRQEIERAIRSGKIVIPVLIDETEMPREEQLPSWYLQNLPDKQGVQVRQGSHFSSDIKRLLNRLDEIIEPTE